MTATTRAPESSLATLDGELTEDQLALLCATATSAADSEQLGLEAIVSRSEELPAEQFTTLCAFHSTLLDNPVTFEETRATEDSVVVTYSTEATTPVSQREGLIGAAADPSTPGGTATAGRTRLPDSVSGGDVSVDAPVNVRIEASIDNLDQELDRQLQQIKTEILREVQQEETTSGISQRQQRTLRRGI